MGREYLLSLSNETVEYNPFYTADDLGPLERNSPVQGRVFFYTVR